MIIYHTPTGRIIVTYFDKDVFSFDTPPGALEFNIDELAPDNKGICIDVIRKMNKLDDAGDAKYYMFDNLGVWELHTKDGWVEKIEEFF